MFTVCFLMIGLSLAQTGCFSNSPTSGPAQDLNLNRKNGFNPSKNSYCPQIFPAFQDDSLQFFAPNGADLLYEAKINTLARSCQISYDTDENGEEKENNFVNVVASGKVTPGPGFKSRTLSLPIHVIIQQKNNVLFEKLYNYPVRIAGSGQPVQYIFRTGDIAIPANSEDILILVGYQKKQSQDSQSDN